MTETYKSYSTTVKTLLKPKMHDTGVLIHMLQYCTRKRKRNGLMSAFKDFLFFFSLENSKSVASCFFPKKEDT